MSKVITAEYDASQPALKLPEPLPGVEDHEKVHLRIEPNQEPTDQGERPWLRYCGVLSKEAGESLARAIQEAGFGPINE